LIIKRLDRGELKGDGGNDTYLRKNIKTFRYSGMFLAGIYKIKPMDPG